MILTLCSLSAQETDFISGEAVFRCSFDGMSFPEFPLQVSVWLSATYDYLANTLVKEGFDVVLGQVCICNRVMKDACDNFAVGYNRLDSGSCALSTGV